MTRQKVLVGLLGVGLLAATGFYFLSDAGNYWRDMAATLVNRPAARAPATQRAPINRFTSEPTTTLLRELPRQALFIAAAHQAALPAGDRSVDFDGITKPPPLTCTPMYDVFKNVAQVTVQDAGGKQLLVLELPVPMLDESYPDYAKVAAAVESWCDTQFAPLLKKSPAQAPAPADAPEATTQNLEPLLSQIDPQRAFLAAHELHAAVTRSGESPQRLADLVRAYSNLAEATRYLYSRHNSAFFARALLYAERLVRKHPDLPLAHAARGYAYTLVGQPLQAQRAFANARKLAGAEGELPPWAAMADDLNHFRTRALFDRIGQDQLSPLASYFALLSVEHSGMQSAVINMARLALENNPGALRVINIMTDNSGVALQHETTEKSTSTQFELLSKLADDDTVPEPVKAAAREAKRKSFAPPALLELLATMDRQPASAGQMLPWGAYASISRDALYVSGFRRLYFTQRMYGVDASKRLEAWWEILKDHRFAPLLAGFDRTGKLGGTEAVAAVQRISLDDFYQRMPWMHKTVRRLRPPSAQHPWLENYEYTSDRTTYDAANQLWAFRTKEADAVIFLAALKGDVAESLQKMCPNHPSALANLIVNQWVATKPRAAEIEREMGGHPQVAYALARAYRSEKRYDDAARLLEQVIAVSPDRPVYEELAGLYKDQGNDEKWLEIYEKYLASSEDFGLDHAKKNEEIAYTLMRIKKFERALKYARAAADSYSIWGLLVYASCLTELERYDEAEQVVRTAQARYPGSFIWYRWCQTSGRGDLEAARQASSEDAAVVNERTASDGVLNEVAIYSQIEGQIDRARSCWEAAFRKRRQDPYHALQLALLDLEQGKPQAAQERLDEARIQRIPELPPEFTKLVGNVTPPADDTRMNVYEAAVNEMRRCLDDEHATPQREGDAIRVILDAADTPYRANAAYLFGRFCELRGKPDEAEWWYRASLNGGSWTHSCLPQAAAGLRRLGKEPYPRATTSPTAASTP